MDKVCAICKLCNTIILGSIEVESSLKTHKIFIHVNAFYKHLILIYINLKIPIIVKKHDIVLMKIAPKMTF